MPPSSSHAANDAQANVQALLDGRRPQGCLVIAEIGVNHDGSVDQAIELVDCARRGGVDAVKLQLFEPAELCSRLHRADEIAMLEALRLSDDEHARICRHAADSGLPVIATPFDQPSLELLCRLDIAVIKIASGEVTHTPFLADVARCGKPVILSTGGCEWVDVERAVGVLRDNGCARLSLLHCVSAYPPPDGQVNLRVMCELARRYPDCNVGFSDHTQGLEAPLAAVALGAAIIEKHLTLDCGLDGPDHAASADPAAFARLVAGIRRVEQMLGDGRKRIEPCEGTIGRSVVAARDLPAGHVLTAADVAFKRPGTGVRPWAVSTLLGKPLRRDIARDDLLTPAALLRATPRSAVSGAPA